MSGGRVGPLTGSDGAPVVPTVPTVPTIPRPSPAAGEAPVNPAPAQAALAVFIFREVIAVLFVAGWLILFAGELVTGKYEVPFWFHVVGVGVMAYALGINVAELTAFRPPSAASVLARG